MLNILKYRDVKRSNSFASAAGDRYKITKHGRVEEDGTITLVEDGRIDLQEKIQSYEPSTNIYNIINRIGMENLQADVGNYFDATQLPNTYAEVLQLFIDGHNAFDRLPVEVKQKFDNDFNKWFASAGSDEWFEKCGYKLETKPVVNPEQLPVEEINEEVIE